MPRRTRGALVGAGRPATKEECVQLDGAEMGVDRPETREVPTSAAKAPRDRAVGSLNDIREPSRGTASPARELQLLREKTKHESRHAQSASFLKSNIDLAPAYRGIWRDHDRFSSELVPGQRGVLRRMVRENPPRVLLRASGRLLPCFRRSRDGGGEASRRSGRGAMSCTFPR